MTRSPASLFGLACLSGLMLAASFPLGPPLVGFQWPGWWPLGWVALVPLMVACLSAPRPRTAALLGLGAGCLFALLLLAWFHPFFTHWGALSSLEALGVTLALTTYVGLYVALFGWALRRISGRFGRTAALLAAPALWVALELARNDLFTGFAWGLLGYSQQPFLPAVQVARLGGIHAVSFVLVCASAALALWIEARRFTRPGWILLAAPALSLIYGTAVLARAPGGSGPGIPVALIQANVPQSLKWDPEERIRIEADHVRLTEAAARAGARLIVWSEASVPLALTQHPEFGARLADLARRTQSDLVVGSVAYEQEAGRRVPYNSAFLFRADSGESGRYDKQHLVPFGEYVPLHDYLFFLAPLVAEASDFGAGAGAAPLPARSARLGILICYEAVFPYLSRRAVREGAALLVNLTNDAWYGDTAMPRQHLAMSALRAVESGRWLLRCANTGISAVISPQGRLAGRAPLDAQEALRADAWALTDLTLYARWGDAPAIACAILAALATVWSFRRAHSRGSDVP